MARLKMAPPWDIHYRKMSAFFANDSEVTVIYDEDENTIKLYVSNSNKANALDKLIGHEEKFGNVELKIKIIPANGYLAKIKDNTIKDAFKNNSAVSEIIEVNDIYSFNATYVIFKKEVVQFFTDNLGDYNGVTSTLYENIARDIFRAEDNVFFCTNTQNSNVWIANDSASIIDLGRINR